MAGPNTLPLACYGKLPFWPEYLDRGIAFPTSQALRDFFHHGRAEAGLDRTLGENSPRETRSRRFAIALPRSVEVSVGVVRPSSDLGGRRAFPFAALVHVPRRTLSRQHSLMPLALEPVWEALEDAWSELAGCVEENSFEETLRMHRIPAPTTSAEHQRALESRLGEEARGLVAGREDADLGALASSFPEVVKAIRQGGERGLALSLPVHREDDDRAFASAFWMELLARQFWWRRAEPSFFLDTGPAGGDPDVVLVFGDLRSEFYPSVMGADGVGDVMRPCEGRAIVGAMDRATITYGDLLRARFGP